MKRPINYWQPKEYVPANGRHRKDHSNTLSNWDQAYNAIFDLVPEECWEELVPLLNKLQDIVYWQGSRRCVFKTAQLYEDAHWKVDNILREQVRQQDLLERPYPPRNEEGDNDAKHNHRQTNLLGFRRRTRDH